MRGAVAQLEHERAPAHGHQERPAPRRVPAVIVPISGALFVTAIAVLQWRFWNGGLGVPVSYEGDATFYHGLTNTMAREGWFFTNPLLGFPHEQVMYDFPRMAEGTLHFLGLRVLAWGSDDPFLVNNLFLLLTFPAVFASAWFVFRRLRFSAGVACAAAVVYAILPFHFVRRDTHLLLSAYWAVPLGCLLLYELLADKTDDEPSPATDRRQRVRRFLVSRWFWIPIVIGAAGGYLALFFGYLMALVGIAVSARHRDWRRMIRPLVCVALSLGVLLASYLPTFIYQWRHGGNDAAAARALGDNDFYGLQLAYLVLPIDNHRISALTDFKGQLSDSISPLRDPELQSLGTLAAIGLFISLGALLFAAVRSGHSDRWGRVRQQSGALNVAAILLATVGGLSTLVGLFGFLQVRAYNRVSIFIAFFSLVALATVVESLFAKRSGRQWQIVMALVLIAVCLFAAFDQTSVIPTRRDKVAAAVESDRDFVQRVERELGGQGEVFELPLVEQPEIVIPGIEVDAETQAPYSTEELGKPALFSDSLRWSWGAMRGRPEDLTPSYVQRPLESLLPDLDALDFDGIYIDRRGFVDRGREVEARLEELTGTKALVSEDQTKSFFDLRPYRRTLPPPSESMREAARHPLQLDWNGGFGSLHDSGRFYPQLSSTTSVRSGSQGATLRVENTRSATRRLSLHANAQLTGGGEGTLEVRAPGTELDFAVGPGPTPIVIEVEIPPGSTTISFRTKPTGPATANGDEQPPTFSLREVWFDGPFVSV